MSVVLATGLLYSFQQADLHGKVIVFVLCIGSALTWTVMLTKWQQLRRARESGSRFISQFRRDADPLHLFINNYEAPEDCPLYNIYRLGAEEVSAQFARAGQGRTQFNGGGYKTFGGGTATALAEPEVAVAQRPALNTESLRSTLGRAIDKEVIKLESHISILSTAVTAGPFMGLLGAAWGVMSVFASMGVSGSVRIGAVAPGISAALLATVVGLLVAVPSLFAYNWLAARIRHQTMEMEHFADEFMSAVENNYS
jgi:biopolymer transport protein TolQ